MKKEYRELLEEYKKKDAKDLQDIFWSMPVRELETLIDNFEEAPYPRDIEKHKVLMCMFSGLSLQRVFSSYEFKRYSFLFKSYLERSNFPIPKFMERMEVI